MIPISDFLVIFYLTLKNAVNNFGLFISVIPQVGWVYLIRRVIYCLSLLIQSSVNKDL